MARIQSQLVSSSTLWQPMTTSAKWPLKGTSERGFTICGGCYSSNSVSPSVVWLLSQVESGCPAASRLVHTVNNPSSKIIIRKSGTFDCSLLRKAALWKQTAVCVRLITARRPVRNIPGRREYEFWQILLQSSSKFYYIITNQYKIYLPRST